MNFARTPDPPYVVVVFTSQLRDEARDYHETAERMAELARGQPGFLGMESARSPDGFGITVAYFRDEAAVTAWRRHAEHRLAQERGRRDWYEGYRLRTGRVERERVFDAPRR